MFNVPEQLIMYTGQNCYQLLNNQLVAMYNWTHFDVSPIQCQLDLYKN
jgi:hypothetical protein